jgi:pyrroloquinoline quinone biosynthesis protein E
MPEPCRSCDDRELDWGGCRYQAMAILGDAGATDPACHLSPRHAVMSEIAEAATADTHAMWVYRGVDHNG